MSAGTRILQQVDGLDTLREIIGLMKNPDAMVEAQELARKEMALTEDEKAKTDEARSFIAQYEKLSKELKAGQDALAAEKSAHADHVTKTSSLNEVECRRLAELSVTLSDRAKMHDIAEKNLAAERQKFEADKGRMAEDHKAAISKMKADAADLERTRAAHETERTRLSNFETTLKAKAARLRESAADI